jgi:uncharacterized protein YdaT
MKKNHFNKVVKARLALANLVLADADEETISKAKEWVRNLSKGGEEDFLHEKIKVSDHAQVSLETVVDKEGRKLSDA